MSTSGLASRFSSAPEVAAAPTAEIVQLDPARQNSDRVPAVLDVAPAPGMAASERHPREHRHAMIGFLPMHVHVRETELPAQLGREPPVLDLDLLQAQDVQPQLAHDPPEDDFRRRIELTFQVVMQVGIFELKSSRLASLLAPLVNRKRQPSRQTARKCTCSPVEVGAL